jgi:hypothetical protein
MMFSSYLIMYVSILPAPSSYLQVVQNDARKYFLSKCFRSAWCNLGNEVPR